MMDTGYAAIMKGFSDFDDFQAELGVYMHLEYFKFQYMPKLYKYGCTEEQIYIAVEDLGDEPLKLTTKDDFKRFAFDLIKVKLLVWTFYDAENHALICPISFCLGCARTAQCASDPRRFETKQLALLKGEADRQVIRFQLFLSYPKY